MNRVETWLRNEYTDTANKANFLRELYLERNELYGILITILRDSNKTSLTITDDDLKEASKHEILIKPGPEEKGLDVSIRDYVEKEEAGSE